VTLKDFFKTFDLFADAPNAVTKMRELIRNLAIRGKLSEQKQSEGTAAELLAQIATQKGRIAESACSKIASLPRSACGWGIPESWVCARFGDVVFNRDAERVPVSKEERQIRAKKYDYYGASGVIDKIDGFLFEKPLLLIGEDGANLINRSTPIAFIARGKYWVNNHAHVLDGLSEDFLRFLELHINAIDLEAYVTGSAQPKMNQAKMNAIPIALPPLAEQKRIVAKVDQLMALCDQLEAQQQERETRHAALARASLARFAETPNPTNLNLLFHKSYTIPPADLRKSILTLAVRGKLLAREQNEKPTVRSDFSVPFEIPAGWKWSALGSVGVCKTGKTPPTSDPTNYGPGFPFIGPGQITQAGDFIGAEKSITPSGLANSTQADEFDILMVCIGGSIGKTAICRQTIGFNQQINSIRLTRDVPEFIYLALTSSYFQEQVLAKASGSATPIINKGKWEQILIPIPPPTEQRRIVAKVDELMALVDALETQLTTSQTKAAQLMEAVVAELTSPN
jgi:type I restriction enzyme S subunit